MGPWFSGSSPALPVLLWLGGKGAVRKAPGTRGRGVFPGLPRWGRLCRLGRGPWASSLLAASLPPSFIPKIVGSLEEAGRGWGELFLVTGSLSQAPGARVTGRELFAFPLAPQPTPHQGPEGQGCLPGK